MSSYRKIVLLGDSITQYAFAPMGWAGAVANLAQRKCDVVDRGFSGYNTKNVCEHVLHHECMQIPTEEIVALTIFFGANDSVSAEHDQYVSLDDYSSYTTKIVQRFLDRGLASDKIILITPPPLDEKAWAKEMIERGYGNGECNRFNENTKKYAEACVKVAKDLKCRHVDIWESIENPESFSSYLVDGLHFNEKGNVHLGKLLEPHITELIDSLPMVLPDWKTLAELKPASS